MWVYTRVMHCSVHVWVYTCHVYVCVNSPSSLYMIACYSDFGLVHLVTGDSDYARCELDTLTIQRLTHGMIQRFVPVRALQIRPWFGPETTSYHSSVHDSLLVDFVLILILPLNYKFWILYLMIIDTVLW